jgi:hypothetical protein
VLAEAAEPQSPAEPVDARAPPSLGAVLAEAAEPQSPAEFSTPPTQPEAIEASAAEAVGPAADEGELAAEQRPCKKSRLP